MTGDVASGSRPQSLDALFQVDFLFSVELPWGRLSAGKGNERKVSFWRKVVRSVTGLSVGCTDSHNRTQLEGDENWGIHGGGVQGPS